MNSEHLRRGHQKVLGATAATGCGWIILAGFLPVAGQPDAVRILHVYVSLVAGASLTVISGAVAASLQLRADRNHFVWDRLAAAMTEVGAALMGTAIVVGSLWSRLTTGRFWAWQPVLVCVSFMLVGNLGRLALRRIGESRRQRAVHSSILTIFATLDLPLLYLSMLLWRSDRHIESQLDLSPANLGLASIAVSSLVSVPIVGWLSVLRYTTLTDQDRLEIAAIDANVSLRQAERRTIKRDN